MAHVSKKSLIRFLAALCLILTGLIWLGSNPRYLSRARLWANPSLRTIDVNTVPDRIVLDFLDLPAEVESAARATATDEELDSVLREYFGNRPAPEGVWEFIKYGEKYLELAEALLKGKMILPPNPPVDVSFPLDWRMKGVGRNWVSQFHALWSARFLVGAYEETKEIRFVTPAEQIVFDWVEKNPINNPPSPRSWHEGTSSNRLFSLLYFWETYRRTDRPTTGSIARLLLSIKQHAEFLTDPKIYRPAGNHGIRQDWAVLATTIAIPELRACEEWSSTALERFVEQQIKLSVTDEGVEIENSPHYHFYVMHQFRKIFDLVTTGNADVPHELVDIIPKMKDFAMHVLLPNGKVPPIGDSSEKAPDDFLTPDYLAGNPELRYSATSGREGTIPRRLDGLFPKSGYAIFRDTWGEEEVPLEKAMYVNYHATFHTPFPFKHKHDDELSFILYGLGRHWIVDPGKYSYTKSDLMRKYMITASAHNAYVPTDKPDLPRKATTKKKAWMEPIFADSALAAARAHNTRYAGAKLTRTLVFLRDERTIILLDQMLSDEPHDWEGLLHLAPDLAPKIQGLSVVCHAPDMPYALDILTTATAAAELEIVKGRRDPPQGWVSPEWHEAVAAPVLVCSRPGNSWTAATILRIRANDTPGVEKLVLEEEAGSFTVRYQVGDIIHSISISQADPLAVAHKTLSASRQ